MAVVPDIEYFPKERVTKSYVEREKNQRQSQGAVKAEITEDAKNWILTTLWPSF
jgi:hypothetical protein